MSAETNISSRQTDLSAPNARGVLVSRAASKGEGGGLRRRGVCVRGKICSRSLERGSHRMKERGKEERRQKMMARTVESGVSKGAWRGLA